MNKIVSLIESEHKYFRFDFDSTQWNRLFLNNKKGIELFMSDKCRLAFPRNELDCFNDADIYNETVSLYISDMYIYTSNISILVKYANVEHSANHEFYKKYLSSDHNYQIVFFAACYVGRLDICEYIYNLDNDIVKYAYKMKLFVITYKNAIGKSKETILKIFNFIYDKYNELCFHKNSIGQNIFELAIKENDFETVKFLLDLNDKHLVKKGDNNISHRIHAYYKIDENSVLYYLCTSSLILDTKILEYLFKFDPNIYNIEPNKKELLAKIRDNQNCGIILTCIIDHLAQ